MPPYDTSENGFKSLSTQIREAEMQVLECQRSVRSCAGTLLHKTQQQMIAPSNLLLAGGIGFIIGELMKLKSSQRHSPADDSSASGSADITGMMMDALNTFNTIRSLYTTVHASLKPIEARADE